MSLLSWYRKKVDEAYKENLKAAEEVAYVPPPKKVDVESYDEKFEWEVVQEYCDYQLRSHYPHIYFTPVELSGRWKIAEEHEGDTVLFLEVIKRESLPFNYLDGKQEKLTKIWVSERKLSIRPKTLVTINECGGK